MSDYRPKIEQRALQHLLQLGFMLAITLLQIALAPTLWRFRADWVLVVVVGWTLLRGLVPGLRWAIYGGLSLDLLSSQAVGSHLIALMICVIGIASLTESLDRDQVALIIACMIGASLVYGVVLLVIQRYTIGPVPWSSLLVFTLLPTALVNAIAVIPTHALLSRFVRRGQPKLSQF